MSIQRHFRAVQRNFAPQGKFLIHLAKPYLLLQSRRGFQAETRLSAATNTAVLLAGNFPPKPQPQPRKTGLPRGGAPAESESAK